jgi:hypothetical protein
MLGFQFSNLLQATDEAAMVAHRANHIPKALMLAVEKMHLRCKAAVDLAPDIKPLVEHDVATLGIGEPIDEVQCEVGFPAIRAVTAQAFHKTTVIQDG